MFTIVYVSNKSNGKLESFKLNKNGNIAYQNLWDVTKTVILGDSLALNPSIRNKSPTNHYNFHTKKLQREMLIEHKIRRKETIRMRVE